MWRTKIDSGTPVVTVGIGWVRGGGNGGGWVHHLLLAGFVGEVNQPGYETLLHLRVDLSRSRDIS